SSYFIRSYSWEVVATRSSPTYTSQKGLQPWRCLLKRGTGVMVMEWMRRGLLWGMMGSSAIMSHMYSMYLHIRHTHTHTHTHTHIHTCIMHNCSASSPKLHHSMATVRSLIFPSPLPPYLLRSLSYLSPFLYPSLLPNSLSLPPSFFFS